MLTSLTRAARSAVGLALAVVMGATGLVASSPRADAAPTASAVIVPNPCAVAHPFPTGSTPAQIRDAYGAAYGFTMVGSYWTDPSYQGIVRVIWETTDALACTPFLTDLTANHGSQLALNASALSGWKSGDYGITRSRTVSLDFPQLKTYYDKGDQGHVARLFVHEITHAYQANRDSRPAYWTSFTPVYNRLGRLGTYGWDPTEVQAEVVGWYVARCAQNNPYTTRYQGYYDWAKTIFGGKEFGPPLGQPLDCSRQVFPAPPPPPPPAPPVAPTSEAPAEAAPAPTPHPSVTAEAAAPATRLEPFDPMMAGLSSDDAPALLAAQR